MCKAASALRAELLAVERAEAVDLATAHRLWADLCNAAEAVRALQDRMFEGHARRLAALDEDAQAYRTAAVQPLSAALAQLEAAQSAWTSSKTALSVARAALNGAEADEDLDPLIAALARANAAEKGARAQAAAQRAALRALAGGSAGTTTEAVAEPRSGEHAGAGTRDGSFTEPVRAAAPTPAPLPAGAVDAPLPPPAHKAASLLAPAELAKDDAQPLVDDAALSQTALDDASSAAAPTPAGVPVELTEDSPALTSAGAEAHGADREEATQPSPDPDTQAIEDIGIEPVWPDPDEEDGTVFDFTTAAPQASLAQTADVLAWQTASDDEPAVPDEVEQIGDAVEGPDLERPRRVAASPVAEDRLGIVLGYLDRNELALGAMLAHVAEGLGEALPVPSALLTFLAMGRSLQTSQQVADERFANALARAADVAPMREAEEATRDACRALLVAGALRPALFDVNGTVRNVLQRVPRKGTLEPMSALLEDLSTLDFGVQLTLDDLARMNGAQRAQRMPLARTRLQARIDCAPMLQTTFVPAVQIWRAYLRYPGSINAAAIRLLKNESDAPEQAREILARLLDNRAAQEALARKMELEIARQKSKAVGGNALGWFCKNVNEFCQIVEEFLEAREADAAPLVDHAVQRATTTAERLKSQVDALLQVEDQTGTDLQGCAQRVLRSSLVDLQKALQGEIEQQPDRPDVFRRALWRLPAPALPLWTQDRGWPPPPPQTLFASEAGQANRALLNTLCLPQEVSESDQAAFEARLREGAIATAREILEDGRLEGDRKRLREHLDHRAESLRKSERAKVQVARIRLTSLIDLDVELRQAGQEWINRLDMIASALAPPERKLTEKVATVVLPVSNGFRDPLVPPDFPELVALLDDAHAFAEKLTAAIRDQQKARLAQVAQANPRLRNTAQRLIARVADFREITLDDMIAELEANREPMMREEKDEPDIFDTFFAKVLPAITNQGVLRPDEFRKIRENVGRPDPMELRTLTPRVAEMLEKRLQLWQACATQLSQRQMDNLRKNLAEVLKLIGFEDSKVTLRGDANLRLIYTFDLQCTPFGARSWFLPHVFGSQVRSGQFHLAVTTREASPQQIADIVGSAADRPWIIVQLDLMSAERRRDLGVLLRKDRRHALALDYALFLHAVLSDRQPLQTFVTCAAPFSWLQPYYTEPRTVPPELFFGRREEIRAITSRSAQGSLVYGGRQLGKSALLTQIVREKHRPAEGHLAVDIDIAGLGSPVEPPGNIWRIMADKLQVPLGLDMSKPIDSQRVISSINAWLQTNGERTILVLLDEADQFLRAEYPNFVELRRIKDLMEGSDRRFKASFVGLHNVRRLSTAPNSPLVHLGDPICIGPMNGSAENRRELRRLVVEPMKAAGFIYESDELPNDILARVNHYPSLVQVFGAQVVEMSRQSKETASGAPRWNLLRDTLFEGDIADRISDEIRKRFQWTLDLDPRYDLIAKCLALHRLDSETGTTDVLLKGLSATEIAQIVQHWWPSSIEWPKPSDFRELLFEMRDLGVLGDKGTPGDSNESRFGLRSAQVGQLLGSRETIEDQILELAQKEPAADYDAGLYHRPCRSNDLDSLSPLSDRDVRDLFDTRRPPLRIVAASGTLWGEGLASDLTQLAKTWEYADGCRLAARLHNGDSIELARLLDRAAAAHGEAPAVLVFKRDWEPELADQILRRCQRTGETQAVVWLVPPPGAAAARAQGFDVRTARPIGELMLRHWLRGHGLSRLDEPDTRRAILAATGGLPLRLGALRSGLADLSGRATDVRLARLEAWRRSTPLRPALILPEAGRAIVLDALDSLRTSADEDETREELLASFPELQAWLPLIEDLGLAERRADERIGLTHLGRLVAEAPR